MGVFEAFALFLLMLPLAAMPSASVALVVARSVSSGRLSGAFAALGIVVGDLVFVVMALVGMSVVAETLGVFFTIVKYCSGAYLMWLGWQLLKSKPARPILNTIQKPSSLIVDFLAGLFLTLGDVKAILFYASLFPALVQLDQLDVWDVSAIAGITVVTVGGVKLLYVMFAADITDGLQHRISSDLPRKIGGVLMLGCGSALMIKT